MDLQRMMDFGKRLQAAHADAVQRGDKAAADGYGQVADQLQQHVQSIAQQQQGASQGATQQAPPIDPSGQTQQPANFYDGGEFSHQQIMNPTTEGLSGPGGHAGGAGVPGGPVRTASPGRTIGYPQQAPQGPGPNPNDQGPTLDMLTKPLDLQREAAQEQGQSWLSKLFGGSQLQQNAHGQTPMAAEMGDTRRGPLKYLWDQVNPSTAAKVGIAATGPVGGSAVAANQALDSVLNLAYPAGHPGDASGMPLQDAKKSVNWQLNGPLDEADRTIPISTPTGPDPELAAGNASNPGVGNKKYWDPETDNPTPKPDPYAILGKDPSEMGVWDAIGLLLGGKNYLQYKDKQADMYNQKKFQISQQMGQDAENEKLRQMGIDQQTQKLGVDYATKMAEQAQKGEESDNSNAARIASAMFQSPTAGDATKNPFVAGEMNRLQQRGMTPEQRAKMIADQKAQTKKGN